MRFWKFLFGFCFVLYSDLITCCSYTVLCYRHCRVIIFASKKETKITDISLRTLMEMFQLSIKLKYSFSKPKLRE